MSRFLSLHHVSLLVADTERSLRFYAGVLGMEVSGRRPELGFPGAWLEVGEGGQIHLLELESPDPVSGRPERGGRDRHVALMVDDLAALRGALELAGIPFTMSRSGRPALFCRDPDGNALELIERS
ncbi:VOC family protein [Endothiovibrio diazotrophicus]